LVEVAHDGAVAVAHHGAHRNRDLHVLAAGAVPLLSRPVHAVRGAPVGVVAEAEQRGLVLGGDQPHVAAVAAVAAVGTAPVHVCLAPPGDRARAAVAGPRVQLGLVDEAGHGEKA